MPTQNAAAAASVTPGLVAVEHNLDIVDVSQDPATSALALSPRRPSAAVSTNTADADIEGTLLDDMNVEGTFLDTDLALQDDTNPDQQPVTADGDEESIPTHPTIPSDCQTRTRKNMKAISLNPNACDCQQPWQTTLA